MPLKGILYRKLQERKMKRLVSQQQKKFSKGTQQLLGKLNETIEKELLKSERSTDAKVNSVVKTLQTLISINKKIVKQNQKIISMLEKRKKISFRV